ncbi:MAG: nucleotidyl transferase AbiEii/AbiGii toxin family protein [Candidatus Omnitrophota bacterium]|jgi:predicted nucleotidyltransferase component of viral defense system|nr:nucleotidyl transferase AbiEii/AbiGii toxin family protein [Candidatus Omnitrophota bacterium]
MNTLQRHEIFEIEVLDKMKSGKFLEPLVFGGGTCLRLCYELNRYSADLDFWFIRKAAPGAYFRKLRQFLSREYEVTDAHIKFHTLLFEIRSKNYPKRLKIEIRKGIKECDTQERIAFSKNSTKQVILTVKTPEQTIKDKVEAAIDRGEIRDCFDIEFLLRMGIPLPSAKDDLDQLKQLISKFKKFDYSVTLGSLLDPDTRKYYVDNKFSYLLEKITIAS